MGFTIQLVARCLHPRGLAIGPPELCRLADYCESGAEQINRKAPGYRYFHFHIGDPLPPAGEASAGGCA